ncbi:beta-galactosidase [Fervidobacterium thailandense]|uniref:Beta-galactosidase n=1 Tax=Fervidobacterium thailandense TaxID=1008305 RepID=A0A1E3G212_9BACT|nr:beta-galactosidase [Fervidobacterium thailandense]ODN30307.1 beta-galactosidase [Fervidobacterium thailandense]
MKFFGADYYPEHWDRETWRKHVELMKNYGIEWVRIGEFAWSIVEPTDGVFDFSLLDEAVSLLKDNGMKVIMGTPTATPPAWLVKKYPEILPVDYSGRVRSFGSRRHYSTNSKVYRDYALRITEMYAKHFGDSVDAWQIDNEFGCHGTTYSFSEADRKAFIEWLKAKYGTIEELNRSWGTVFWSQIYSDWDEIVFPINTPTFENPHQMLDIYRFMSDSSIEFLRLQADVIRKYSSKPITHNFMVDFMDIDYRKMARYVDFVSWDNYIATEVYDPLRQSANHSLMRSLKHAPFLVIEQQPGRVNWRQRNENYSASHLSMWTKQCYLNGAMGVMVFRFDQIRFGAEQFHGGLLDYAGRVTKRLEEFSKCKAELGETVIPKREVAIYFDYEVEWMHRINHVNRDFRYWDSLVEIYRAVKRLGYNVEFVFSDDELNGYSLLIVPYALHIPEEFRMRISKFEGPVVMTCMSGVKDERNWIVERAPQDLIEEFGVEVMDFGAVKNIEILAPGKRLAGKYWVDELRVCDASVIGILNDGTPIITRKMGMGNGASRYYVGTVLDEDGWIEILKHELEPRIVGDDVEVSNLESEKVWTLERKLMGVLNLKATRNVAFVGGRKIDLEPFQLLMLEG